MADQHVLRLCWIDPDRDSFALLHVQANGPHPLDVNLVGTDGENVFVGSGKAKEFPLVMISLVPSFPLFSERERQVIKISSIIITVCASTDRTSSTKSGLQAPC
jgi:hypothetical protein